MKVITPSHEYIGRNGMTPYQFIEKIGRVCYKSEDKITENSADRFVSGLQKSGHYAMLEHYWVHFVLPNIASIQTDLGIVAHQFGDGSITELDKFVQLTITSNYFYVSAPLRVFLEIDDRLCNLSFSFNGNITPVLNRFWQSFKSHFPFIKWKVDTTREISCSDVLVYFDEQQFINHLQEDLLNDEDYRKSNDCILRELMKHKTHTFNIVCDRGVSHELVRHRLCSFAQESTRYCNYSKEKFGNELTFIKPCFFDTLDGIEQWEFVMSKAEEMYFGLLKQGKTPQEARTVLPNSLKTEIVVTANETEWQHIVNLRVKGLTGSPHPQMKEVMTPIYEELKTLSDGRIA